MDISTYSVNTSEPLYIQIKNNIIQSISSGALKKGDQLPSVRELASFLDVNMHTVNKSYAALKSEGFINIERGKGAFISLDLKNSNPLYKDKLRSLISDISSECNVRGISKKDFLKIIEEEF